jgi:protein-arginine kinase activator protein McsA
MSRAFRDTFKQTFCLCEKIDRHQSTISFAHVSKTKHRKKHLNQTVAYETVTTYKYPDVDRTSLTPIMKIIADNQNKKKKRTSIALQFFNHNNSTPS